ncbi:uncharacterized protein PAF06_007722 [Gastrophryne carolinensis]
MVLSFMDSLEVLDQLLYCHAQKSYCLPIKSNIGSEDDIVVVCFRGLLLMFDTVKMDFTVEAQYIKNLQEQIYFLEREAGFLYPFLCNKKLNVGVSLTLIITREQTKKATDLQPQLTMEAELLLKKLTELRSDTEGLKLEVKRKDANLLLLHRDQEHVQGQIKDTQASYTKEKKKLLEEIVQLKKMKELSDKQISEKEIAILHSKQELEREILGLTDTNQRVQGLQAQLKLRSKNQEEMESQLSQRRMELLKLNSAKHGMEEKLLKHTATTQSQLTHDLRNEISFLHQQLCEKDLLSEQDRVLKIKMMDDCASLSRENSELQAELLELTKQLELQRALKAENYTHASSSITQLLGVKDREEQLSREVKRQQAVLEQEKERVKDLMGQMDLLLSGSMLQGLSTNTLGSHIAELQAKLAKEEQINTELLRDKTLLVDHVCQLQNKITRKETELIQISSRIAELDNSMSIARAENSLQQSLQSVSWKEISDLTHSVNKLSRSLKTF